MVDHQRGFFLSRILKTLEGQPDKKKISTLVKAITDDIVDGKLSFFREVGIKIDLLHPNLSFLLKKIRNFQPNRAQTPGGSSGAVANRPGVAGAGGARKIGNLSRELQGRNITVSVAKGDNRFARQQKVVGSRPGKRLVIRHRVGKGIYNLPKAKVVVDKVDSPGLIDLTEHYNARKRKAVEIDNHHRLMIQAGMGVNAAENLKIPQPATRSRVSPDKLEDVKRTFQSLLPTTRPLKADILRFIFTREETKTRLLKKVGINFDEGRGGFLCPDGMNSGTVFRCMSKIAPLADVQWAVIMAETVFKLLDADDCLTLPSVGISIDVSHPKVPLFYRIQMETRAFLISNSSENLASHLCYTFDLNTSPACIKAVENVFNCTYSAAAAFIRSGFDGAPPPVTVVPIKYRNTPSGGAKRGRPPTNLPAKRKKKTPKYTESDDDDFDYEDEMPYKRKYTKRTRPSGPPTEAGEAGVGSIVIENAEADGAVENGGFPSGGPMPETNAEGKTVINIKGEEHVVTNIVSSDATATGENSSEANGGGTGETIDAPANESSEVNGDAEAQGDHDSTNTNGVAAPNPNAGVVLDALIKEAVADVEAPAEPQSESATESQNEATAADDPPAEAAEEKTPETQVDTQAETLDPEPQAEEESQQITEAEAQPEEEESQGAPEPAPEVEEPAPAPSMPDMDLGSGFNGEAEESNSQPEETGTPETAETTESTNIADNESSQGQDQEMTASAESEPPADGSFAETPAEPMEEQ